MEVFNLPSTPPHPPKESKAGSGGDKLCHICSWKATYSFHLSFKDRSSGSHYIAKIGSLHHCGVTEHCRMQILEIIKQKMVCGIGLGLFLHYGVRFNPVSKIKENKVFPKFKQTLVDWKLFR